VRVPSPPRSLSLGLLGFPTCSLSLSPVTSLSVSSAPMADSDAKPPTPGGDAASSPIASISPSDAAAIEEQLAGLGLTVAGGGAGFEPSGWDDGPAPVAAGDDEVVPGDKVQEAAVSAPAADARVRFPRRPGEPDCSYYVKFGTCRFGTKCKFNHPARKKKSKVGRASSQALVMAIFVYFGRGI
jgi:hypothetical protein